MAENQWVSLFFFSPQKVELYGPPLVTGFWAPVFVAFLLPGFGIRTPDEEWRLGWFTRVS